MGRGDKVLESVWGIGMGWDKMATSCSQDEDR